MLDQTLVLPISARVGIDPFVARGAALVLPTSDVRFVNISAPTSGDEAGGENGDDKQNRPHHWGPKAHSGALSEMFGTSGPPV